MPRSFCVCCCAVVASAALSLAGLSSSAGAASVSYSAAANLPPAPPFFRFDANVPINPNPFGYNAPQSVAGGTLSAGPTDAALYTFYFTNALVLDHTQRIEISAELRLLSSVNTSRPEDRSGLGIAFTDNRNLYTELYIAPTEIILNGAGRVRAAAASLDTSVFHTYKLVLESDVLEVYVDDVPTLTGGIFDATGFGAPTLPNWASVGDITSNASGAFEMKSFTVSVIPEPAALTAAMLALLPLRRRRPLRVPRASP